MSTPSALPPFTNEPFKDFTDPATRRAMLEALDHVRGRLGATYELIIGNAPAQSTQTFTSTNPARPGEVIGIHYAATEADTSTDTKACARGSDEHQQQRIQCGCICRCECRC